MVGHFAHHQKCEEPGLAINNNGTLAFLYQQVVTNPGGKETWLTQVELTKDDFKSANPPLTLSRFPAVELDSISGQPRLETIFTLWRWEMLFTESSPRATCRTSRASHTESFFSGTRISRPRNC